MSLAPAILALVASTGVALLVLPPSGKSGSRKLSLNSAQRVLDEWFAQAGLADVSKQRVALLVSSLFALGTLVGWVFFGGIFAPIIAGVFAASFPVASLKAKRKARRTAAADAWPRMIEEIRLLCGSLGRPIPQALLEVGKHGPPEMRPAFLKAEREWLMSTDFNRTIEALKEQLADPTADATCETLLVAHQIGGTDVDRRLAALAEDRLSDLRGRKDARAKQAGVKFARRFVLIVPVGMALAGMSIGSGRAAYATTQGQIGVAIALASLAGCWWWAGTLISIPEERRVLRG